jgi:hypothetical protein
MNSAKRSTENTQELMYVLTDFSPSMEATDYEPTRIEGAILAIKEFIATKAEFYPRDMVGLIGFDDKAHILHRHVQIGLSGQSLLQALRNSTELDDPGTNFTAALLLAERCLSGKDCHRPGQKITSYLKDLLFEPEPQKTGQIDRKCAKRIILLTDGQHNGGGSPARAAQSLKEAGVVIECIGIAGCPDDVDEKRLRAIASRDKQGDPLYSFIGDTRQLIKKYESMAHHIQAI